MVERFNGRVADVLDTHRFASMLLRYVKLYNQPLPQSALKGQAPTQAMKHWYLARAELFARWPYDYPGLDS